MTTRGRNQRGNKTNEIVVHVSRIAERSGTSTHDSRHQRLINKIPTGLYVQKKGFGHEAYQKQSDSKQHYPKQPRMSLPDTVESAF